MNGAGYNKERDAMISVFFAYAIRKWSKREWFIQQVDDPPDFFMISPTNRAKKPVDRLGVEIIEIRDKEINEAINTLERSKLEKYVPSKGTVLLVFLNNTNAVKVGIGLVEWAVENRSLFENFSELYFLYLIHFSPEDTWTYKIINIFKKWSQVCNLSEEFNKGIIYPHPLIDKHKVKILKK